MQWCDETGPGMWDAEGGPTRCFGYTLGPLVPAVMMLGLLVMRRQARKRDRLMWNHIPSMWELDNTCSRIPDAIVFVTLLLAVLALVRAIVDLSLHLTFMLSGSLIVGTLLQVFCWLGSLRILAEDAHVDSRFPSLQLCIWWILAQLCTTVLMMTTGTRHGGLMKGHADDQATASIGLIAFLLNLSLIAYGFWLRESPDAARARHSTEWGISFGDMANTNLLDHASFSSDEDDDEIYYSSGAAATTTTTTTTRSSSDGKCSSPRRHSGAAGDTVDHQPMFTSSLSSASSQRSDDDRDTETGGGSVSLNSDGGGGAAGGATAASGGRLLTSKMFWTLCCLHGAKLALRAKERSDRRRDRQRRKHGRQQEVDLNAAGSVAYEDYAAVSADTARSSSHNEIHDAHHISGNDDHGSSMRDSIASEASDDEILTGPTGTVPSALDSNLQAPAGVEAFVPKSPTLRGASARSTSTESTTSAESSGSSSNNSGSRIRSLLRTPEMTPIPYSAPPAIPTGANTPIYTVAIRHWDLVEVQEGPPPSVSTSSPLNKGSSTPAATAQGGASANSNANIRQEDVGVLRVFRNSFRLEGARTSFDREWRDSSVSPQVQRLSTMPVGQVPDVQSIAAYMASVSEGPVRVAERRVEFELTVKTESSGELEWGHSREAGASWTIWRSAAAFFSLHSALLARFSPHFSVRKPRLLSSSPSAAATAAAATISTGTATIAEEQPGDEYDAAPAQPAQLFVQADIVADMRTLQEYISTILGDRNLYCEELLDFIGLDRASGHLDGPAMTEFANLRSTMGQRPVPQLLLQGTGKSDRQQLTDASSILVENATTSTATEDDAGGGRSFLFALDAERQAAAAAAVAAEEAAVVGTTTTTTNASAASATTTPSPGSDTHSSVKPTTASAPIAAPQDSWRSLVVQFRDQVRPQSLTIRLITFRGVVSGEAIVEWLLGPGKCSDWPAALRTGQMLLARGVIEAVCCGYDESVFVGAVPLGLSDNTEPTSTFHGAPGWLYRMAHRRGGSVQTHVALMDTPVTVSVAPGHEEVVKVVPSKSKTRVPPAALDSRRLVASSTAAGTSADARSRSYEGSGGADGDDIEEHAGQERFRARSFFGEVDSRGRKVVMKYQIDITVEEEQGGTETWSVAHRYSDFVELEQKLLQRGIRVDQPLPAKTLFRLRATHKKALQDRQEGLQRFIRAVVSLAKTAPALAAREIADFLDPLAKSLRIPRGTAALVTSTSPGPATASPATAPPLPLVSSTSSSTGLPPPTRLPPPALASSVSS